MRVFLTGGTGFIGSNLLNGLQKENFEITALKRVNSSPRINILKEPEWITGDLSSLNKSDLQNKDILIHLASHSSNYPYDSLENCIYWNVNMSLKLLEIAYDAGIRKFLIAGSCFEYGKSALRFDKIPINAPLEPTISYAVSKAMASIAMQYWAKENKCYFHYFRLFHVYGQGEEQNRLWPSLKKAALLGEDFELTQGQQIRDFTPIDFVVKEIIKLTKFKNIKNGFPQLSNLSYGKPKTLKQFTKLCWKNWSAKGKLKFGSLPYRKNEIMNYVPLIKK